MGRHPDSYYQRFTAPRCQCSNVNHKHEDPCGSRRYLIVHHKDHARQDQKRENLITLCSSCHRKEHREQSFYFGRNQHKDFADQARLAIQRAQLEKEMRPKEITDDDEV